MFASENFVYGREIIRLEHATVFVVAVVLGVLYKSTAPCPNRAMMNEGNNNKKKLTFSYF